MQEKRLPREYIRRIWRAIYEFSLLEPGDRVLVGFSGGKDSLFLLFALAVLREHPPFPFELGAVTVDMGFEGGHEDREILAEYCRSLEVPFHWIKTGIAGIVFDPEAVSKDPCAKCSLFRRAVLAEAAVERGYSKLALAHHNDDAVETFLMSIIYSGQIRTFAPKSFMERSGITVIRPLAYLREHEVRKGAALSGLEPLKSRCPLDRHTKRQEIKELLARLTHENRFVYTNVAAAMRAGRPIELWPAALTSEDRRRVNFGAWGKNAGDHHPPQEPDPGNEGELS